MSRLEGLVVQEHCDGSTGEDVGLCTAGFQCPKKAERLFCATLKVQGRNNFDEEIGLGARLVKYVSAPLRAVFFVEHQMLHLLSFML